MPDTKPVTLTHRIDARERLAVACKGIDEWTATGTWPAQEWHDRDSFSAHRSTLSILAQAIADAEERGRREERKGAFPSRTVVGAEGQLVLYAFGPDDSRRWICVCFDEDNGDTVLSVVDRSNATSLHVELGMVAVNTEQLKTFLTDGTVPVFPSRAALEGKP